MSEEGNLLGLVISHCFGVPRLEWFYNLYLDDLLLLAFASFIITIILQSFTDKIDCRDSNIGEVIEVKQYSFAVKTVTVFLILVLFSMPIFKLLNTGYFL